jgi:hypothetical protein
VFLKEVQGSNKPLLIIVFAMIWQEFKDTMCALLKSIFSNALANSYGLQDKIEHKLEDAGQVVEPFSFGEIDHA